MIYLGVPVSYVAGKSPFISHRTPMVFAGLPTEIAGRHLLGQVGVSTRSAPRVPMSPLVARMQALFGRPKP